MKNARRAAGSALSVAIVISASAALLSAQGGRSYGPGQVWWNAGQHGILPWEETYDNPDGQLSILNKTGAVHTEDHPFFEPLGVNGRACITCHQPENAMSVAAATLRERWNETEGKDPVFAAVDGSNCPDLPQTSMMSHSLLLDRGLFRIFLPWPPRTADGKAIEPEFRIEVVRDPTGCNTSPVHGLAAAKPAISVYRRPRVAANLDSVIEGPQGLRFMADGREPSLEMQATTAVLTHQQAKTPPTPEQLRRIVDFETQIYVAQSADIRGGLLTEPGGPAALGPANLASGKAGSFGSGSRSAVLRSFEAWRTPKADRELDLPREFRASVARGSELFFTRRFPIRDVYPVNARAIGNPVIGTCNSCHNSEMTRWMDIGTTNRPAAKDSAELPLFRVTCDSSALPHPFLGHVIYTHDPGRALITGKCADVGSIVMQQFRGLAARAPYFSNGSAKNLREVVEFYDRRFEIGYTEQEKQDLVNFLTVL